MKSWAKLEGKEKGMRLPQRVQEKLLDIGNLVISEGSLDSRAKALIALATAVSSYCSHSHGYFADMAKKLGATEAEIEEAEEIAMRVRQRCDNEMGLYSLTEEDAAPI